MLIATLSKDETADVNVQGTHVILSVGSADRVEYEFDTETAAYDAAEEYQVVISDFLGLMRSFQMRRKEHE